MFERKLEEELRNWKKSLIQKKKAFLLKGLRQVGKTFLIKKFASENYENVVYINFKVETELKKAFDGNLTVDNIIRNLTFMKLESKFIPYKTVLIFDEIQECSGARSSIKPFMEDGRFDIIASGSLLGLKGYNRKYRGGVAVGYEHVVYMKPMDFEEFLWAKGISKDDIQYIKDCFNRKEKISNPIHETMFKYFREYICIGGMPAVVDAYIKNNSYMSALTEQHDILEGYKDDFGKHLNENEEEEIDESLLIKINKVFNSIPSQLAKENSKFMYSNVEKKGTSAKFDPAIQWLVDYGLINYCYNLHLIESPFEGNKIENIFKLYYADTGLFVSMLGDDSAKEIMLNNMGQYKGYIYENIIADAFSKLSKPLYYYSKDSGLEVDFITKFNNKIMLVEVKSKNGNAKSSKTILSNKTLYKDVNGLIKLGEYNIGENNNILTLPYYLAFLLN